MFINAFSKFYSSSLANRGCSVILLDTVVQGVHSRNFQLYLHQKIKGNLLLLLAFFFMFACSYVRQSVCAVCASVAVCGHGTGCMWWSVRALAVTCGSVTLGSGKTAKSYFHFFLFSSLSINCPNVFFFARVSNLARAGP